MTHRTRVARRSRRSHRALSCHGTLSLLAPAVIAALGVLAPTAQAKGSYLAGDRSLVNHYASLEGAKLGVSLPGGSAKFITITESPQETLVETQPDGTKVESAAETDCHDSAHDQIGAATGCTITVSRGAHSSENERRSTVAHEVFHAFQSVMSGTLTNFNRPENSWLIEGSATWVEADLINSSASAREWWKRYLGFPDVPLFTRTYSAVGFFGHMASVGLSPWSRFHSIFAATSNPAAYAQAVAGSASFENSVASVFFREPALGSAWDQHGPSVPTAGEVGFKPTKEDVAGHEEILTVAPYANSDYLLSTKHMSASKPVLEIRVDGPHVRVHSTGGGDVNEVEPADLDLCSDPHGCECPSQPGPKLAQFKQGDLALGGGTSGGTVFLIPRPRCETLLGPQTCEGLLPGFTLPVKETLEAATGQKLAIETVDPASGYYSYVCLFPGANGEEIKSGEEEVFDGVGAIETSVARSATIREAELGFSVPPALPGSVLTRPPIGSEAAIETSTTSGPNGEVGYASVAVVRVHNVVATFSIYSSGGNKEADVEGATTLLGEVAAKL